MKKAFSALLAAVLVLCMTFSALAEVTSIPEMGLALDLGANEPNLAFQIVGDDYSTGIAIYYYNTGVLDPLRDAVEAAQMDNDENALNAAITAYSDALSAHSQMLFAVLGVMTDRVDTLGSEYGITADTKCIGSNSLLTYYILPGEENTDLAEEDKPLMASAMAEAQAVIDTVSVIELELTDLGDAMAGALSSFSTVDMNGNAVDQSIFSRADLTILHVWGTYCSPCISEMPELAAWAKELPENVQVVGVIIDVASPSDKNFSKAEKILSKSGAGFTNLLANDSLTPFISTITGVPTTFFIDRSGQAAADFILGANLEGYRSTVEAILAK